MIAAVLTILVAAAPLGVVACGRGEDGGAQARPGIGRAQALAVDPAGAILVGTDRGLFRVTRRGTLRRVGALERDVTGLAFARDGALLSSGHPAPGQPGPGDLGLERSDNGGPGRRGGRPRGPGAPHPPRPPGP